MANLVGVGLFRLYTQNKAGAVLAPKGELFNSISNTAPAGAKILAPARVPK